MDLLESGEERERRPLGPRVRALLAARLPVAVVAVVSVLAAATLGAGLVAAVQVGAAVEREAARVQVDVEAAGSSSSTVSGVARGEIELVLVNRRPREVRLEQPRAEVEGLQVLRVLPSLDPLGPYEERRLRIVFSVPSCSALVLPGVLSVVLQGEGQPPQRRELVVHDAREPGPAGAVPLGACPPSALGADAGTPTDVGVRSAGGAARREGDGALGIVRLEVRNDGRPLRLLSMTAEVPGVVFTPRVIEGGRTIGTDGLVIIRLPFAVPDCSRLVQTGRVVLEVERFGGIQQLGLRVVADTKADAGPQVNLRVVLTSCD